MKPTERTRISGMLESQRIFDSDRDEDSFRPVAITIENCRKNSGFRAITSSGVYNQPGALSGRTTCMTNCPETSGFNSWMNMQDCSALGWPILDSSRKNPTPASSPLTIEPSSIVNPPIPQISSRSGTMK